MKLDPDVERYASALLATGMEEREVARAAFYAQTYGLAAFDSSECVVFEKPSCGDWNCVNPEHQRLK